MFLRFLLLILIGSGGIRVTGSADMEPKNWMMTIPKDLQQLLFQWQREI